MGFQRIWNVLTRRKVVNTATIDDSRLNRCLGVWDLTFLGVGSTLGVGVYVLAGSVAKNIAGPAVCLSFLIAAAVSVFAGLCYAEFGARVPKAGSAYIYSYVCVGEFIAFVIGWNLILEYVIGAASVSRALSQYIDNLAGGVMAVAFRRITPIDVGFLSPYFDFFAFSVIIVLGLALAFGMRESSVMNNIFTTINISVVIFVIVAGSLKAETSNWSIPESSIPADTAAGTGGFLPYGWSGVLRGAAVCFYGFVGFDCVAAAGEEVTNPRRALPLAILGSLGLVLTAYFGMAVVLTMMVPYYLQDVNAPVPYAFTHVGWDWARWLVTVGALFGLCASLFGAMFPLPRIIFSMASDGLLFRTLSRVSARNNSPVIATMLSAVFIGLMAALFNLEHLIAMMSIGTLLAYTLVSASVLLLRYRDDLETDDQSPDSLRECSYLVSSGHKVTVSSVCCQLVGRGSDRPTSLSCNIVIVAILLFGLSSLGTGLCVLHLAAPLVPAAVLAVVAVLLMLIIALQPRAPQQLYFKVPLVPLIPCISIFANLYLMLMLDFHTWIRFGIWMAIGFTIYFGYGVPNSLRDMSDSESLEESASD